MNFVDLFETKNSVLPKGYSKDVHFYLDRIKNGAVKKTIEQIRTAIGKDAKNEIKATLSAVTFAGTFKKRNKLDIKKASGLVILDLDKLKSDDDVLILKEKLKLNKYVYSAWISPSGNGIKVLVKILTVDSNEEYNSFYKSIVKEFNWINKEFGDGTLDCSGSDISRLCFESYDPDLYLNLDSELYTDFIFSEPVSHTLSVVTNIPVTDEDVIANRLLTWFKKIYDSGNRNSSFYKLAIAFSDFGVSKHLAERYILPNAAKDFNDAEIKALINSAYKHTANFGSKHFEDKEIKRSIQSMVLIGKDNAYISGKFKNIKTEPLVAEINNQRKEIDLSKFWEFDDKGKLKLIPHKFKFYLENKHFYKHYLIEKSKTFTFITKAGSFVDEVSEFQIKDFILNEQIQSDDLRPYDLLAASQRAFAPSYLSMLETAKFNIEEDTKEYAMIFYNNLALRVWADKKEKIEYKDLGGFVWKKQVIDREYTDSDHHASEYRTFLWFCASQDKQKYNSLKSVIGYLLHSFKTAANNKAIIFNDETISDNPNGGSGKGIFWNALSKMKKVASIDGKTFEFTKSFPYQTVSTDTQILVFDDVKKNFPFESLFSLITEGITLEYKGQDAIKLPVQKSPKIIITTNYTVNGSGGSFERRKFEVEMSSYFGINHSPLDEFGHMLFDDWNVEEWARFDSFMLYCLQYYLKNGLVKFNFKNLENRKLTNETSLEFLEWANDGHLVYNISVTKSECYHAFCNEYPDLKKWLSQKRFTQWIQKYCEFHKLPYIDGSSNGIRWFRVDKLVNYTELIEDENPF